jgi:hypothetical protein
MVSGEDDWGVSIIESTSFPGIKHWYMYVELS